MEQLLLPQPRPTSTSPPPTSAPHDPPSSSSSSSSSPPILLRLATLLSLAAVSLWANHEASKGFDITFVNAAAHAPAGRWFDLMFISNGRAARLLLSSSDRVARVLYPADEQYPKKPVRHVTLHLAAHNLSRVVLVSARNQGAGGHFDVHLCPSLMAEAADARASVAAAVQRGMARVWLRDGRGAAPSSLLDAMAEYFVTSAGLPMPRSQRRDRSNSSVTALDAPCWAGDHGYVAAAQFLHHCEARRPGFMARLNRAMQEEWHDDMVGRALGSGSSLQRLCSAYRSLTRQPGEVPVVSNAVAEFTGHVM